MNIQPQFIPSAMPKTFKTVETRVKMVKNADGTKHMERKEVEVEGGVLFTMPHGHSVRLSSADQIKQFNVATKPRLVDLDTGEEVDEQGRPLSLVAFTKNSVQTYEDVASALETSEQE